MSKYIDADALIERIEENEDLSWNLDKVMQIAFTSILRHAPAADVEPVNHGKWDCVDAPLNTSNRFCSECGCGEKIFIYNKNDFAFCRHCGSKMDALWPELDGGNVDETD